MAKESYIEVEPGVELYVLEAGEGEPIVFIPGFTFTTEVFQEQLRHFSKTHRTIVIDPRSHGKSTITLHGNEYITHGTDLAKVLETLQVKSATLLGWSFGCLTVWEYIRQFGTDNIKSLVMVDMPPKSLSLQEDQDWVEGKLDDLAAAYNTYLRNPKGQRDFISAYATGVMVQRELKEEELNWIVQQSLQTPYYIAANLFSSGLFCDYREEARVASESVPTLTIVAEHWGEVATAYLQKLAPQGKVKVLGGHMMFWEHSETFNEIIEEFLSA
ncbi:pimeloyl-ACP methyl ester carboxylesterase [Bacillus mesophilus]|uniref:Alpha/beta hydrolase n=1 Tax=Bacillus mesophilus TaxID=1808955 RepID=A0A6M0QD57_9BACI|nr:alpha/beta hydrolase [Bacillus mesophilus]MBM7662901.1 pimeloyl-ACP methyl ester carboxylesterase [Bacillus mesophilus]NEY73490.1 alpha/beta hydrolase [Bacillus mesophilus]